MLSRKVQIIAALVVAVLGLLVFTKLPTVEAQDCTITSFTLSPTDPYILGTGVILSGTSNCGTVKFHITNLSTGESWDKAEIGASNQTETWKTNETGSGNFDVCFLGRGNGGWESAAKACRTVYVEGSQAPPEGSQTGSNVRCWVNGFTVTPSSAPIGSDFQISGQGQCDGNARAARFSIDGNAYGEYGGNTAFAAWNSSGYSVGNHNICFLITSGEWTQAAQSCVSIALTDGGSSSSVVASGAPATNNQSGQTVQSNPDNWVPPAQNGGALPETYANHGMDINGWCISMGHAGAQANGDAYSWICLNADGSIARGVDFDPVCSFSNGGVYPFANLANPLDPFSWSCQDYGQEQRPPNPEDVVPQSQQSQPSSNEPQVGDHIVVHDIPAVQGEGHCAYAKDPQMVVNGRGRVTYTDGSATDVRSAPSGGVIASLAEGVEFTVIGDPVCQNSYLWWPVRLDDGRTGFMPEGTQDTAYWIEPVFGSSATNQPSPESQVQQPAPAPQSAGCSDSLPARLQVPGRGRVTYTDGTPSTLWSTQSLSGTRLASLPEGTEFDVLSGPYCVAGNSGSLNSYQVSVNGQVGYISEGYASGAYWAEPVSSTQSQKNLIWSCLMTDQSQIYWDEWYKNPANLLDLLILNAPNAVMELMMNLLSVVGIGIDAYSAQNPTIRVEWELWEENGSMTMIVTREKKDGSTSVATGTITQEQYSNMELSCPNKQA